MESTATAPAPPLRQLPDSTPASHTCPSALSSSLGFNGLSAWELDDMLRDSVETEFSACLPFELTGELVACGFGLSHPLWILCGCR